MCPVCSVSNLIYLQSKNSTDAASCESNFPKVCCWGKPCIPRRNESEFVYEIRRVLMMKSIFLLFYAVQPVICQTDTDIHVPISIHTPNHGDYWPISNGNLTISVLFTARLGDVVVGIRMNDLIEALDPDPLGSRHLAKGDLGIVLIDTMEHIPSPSRYISRLQIPSATLWFSTFSLQNPAPIILKTMF